MMARLSAPGASVLSIALACGALFGQTPTGPRLELTVDQAVALALRNNRDVEVARVDLLSSETAVVGAGGIFDLVLAFSGFRENRSIPVSSILAGSSTGALHEGEITYTPQVSGLLERLGSSYSASLFNNPQTTENLFVPL